MNGRRSWSRSSCFQFSSACLSFVPRVMFVTMECCTRVFGQHWRASEGIRSPENVESCDKTMVVLLLETPSSTTTSRALEDSFDREQPSCQRATRAQLSKEEANNLEAKKHKMRLTISSRQKVQDEAAKTAIPPILDPSPRAMGKMHTAMKKCVQWDLKST